MPCYRCGERAFLGTQVPCFGAIAPITHVCIDYSCISNVHGCETRDRYPPLAGPASTKDMCFFVANCSTFVGFATTVVRVGFPSLARVRSFKTGLPFSLANFDQSTTMPFPLGPAGCRSESHRSRREQPNAHKATPIILMVRRFQRAAVKSGRCFVCLCAVSISPCFPLSMWQTAQSCARRPSVP